jgi:hypothetical protein
MSLAAALMGAVADARPLQDLDFRRLWVTQCARAFAERPETYAGR